MIDTDMIICKKMIQKDNMKKCEYRYGSVFKQLFIAIVACSC